MKMVLVLLSFVSSAAMADVSTTRAQRSGETSTFLSDVKPYVGLGAGYTFDNRQSYTEGLPGSLKVIGSWGPESSDLVADLGFGLQNQIFSEGGAPDRVVTGTMLEAGLRGKLENKWQVGGVFNHLFNQGRSYAAHQSDAQFIGVQALKEIEFRDDYLIRAGGRLMNSFNPASRSVQMVMADLQITWNDHKKAPAVQAPPVAVIKAQPAEIKPEPIRVSELMKADAKRMQFALNSPKLSTRDQAYLNKLARTLAAHSSEFDKIQIRGLADISGGETHNQLLSSARAQYTKEALVKAGIPASRIEAIGLGEARSRTVIPTDRRAEIELVGLKDEARMREILSTVR